MYKTLDIKNFEALPNDFILKNANSINISFQKYLNSKKKKASFSEFME
jgi:hypothetical protein